MAEVQLVIVDGPNTGREFDLSGAVVVGRGDDAGIVIEDAEASRKHASLSVEGTSVTVEDLGSTNGTFVGGQRISGPRKIVEGERVRIGTTVFELRTLTQPTRLGAAIPEEPDIETQATRVGGTAIPDFTPVDPNATTAGTPAVPEPEPPAPEPPAPEPAAPEPPAPQPVGGPPGPATPPPPSFPPPGGPPPGGPPPGAPPPPSPPIGGPPPGPPPPSVPPPGGPPPGAAPPPPAQPGGFGTPPPPGQPGGFGPPGQVPAPYGGAPLAGAYPIDMEADYPQAGIARWRVFLQGYMAIPHYFVLFFVLIGVYLAFIVTWFSILFTRTYPRGIFEFTGGSIRWLERVTGYQYWFTERYPPFSTGDDPSYPIRVRYAYPEGGIARWRVFLQGFMAIPHYIALAFVGIGVWFALIIAWFSILFTRTYPPGIFGFVLGAQRWGTRVVAYSLLMTEEYPPFSLS